MLNQRGTGHSGVKRFDKVFAILWLLMGLLTPIVAGLDAVRFGWSGLSWHYFYVGVMALALATVFGTWAMLENEHFEQFVRIQDERNHRVVTTGAYQWVRHPGYLAAIAGGMSMPLLLGSVWTIVPVVLTSLLFIVRTKYEDTTLLVELDGYQAYAKQTPYRLVPFIW